MRKMLQRLVRHAVRAELEASEIGSDRMARAVSYVNSGLHFRKNVERVGTLDRIAQIQLLLAYRRLVADGMPLPPFADAEFRSFSQNGEDGILLLLLAVLGMETRRCVEMCAGDGVTCNTANLVLHHGYQGLLFDGSEDNIGRGTQFYASVRDTRLWPPDLVQAWITRDNANDLIARRGVTGEVDVFSLDMDGVDYWIWKELDVIRPRVVVVEYNNLWPADRSVTVPYREDFQTEHHATGADYAGASLAAFVKLGREKGYRLVGAQQYCFNAFFVRDDLGHEHFPEVDAARCLTHPFAVHAQTERYQRIADREWQEV